MYSAQFPLLKLMSHIPVLYLNQDYIRVSNIYFPPNESLDAATLNNKLTFFPTRFYQASDNKCGRILSHNLDSGNRLSTLYHELLSFLSFVFYSFNAMFACFTSIIWAPEESIRKSCDQLCRPSSPGGDKNAEMQSMITSWLYGCSNDTQ
jgi:hypothetical protein